jgi:hypothetical protein
VQEKLLRELAPTLEEGSFVGTVYGQGGFDLIARSVLGDLIEKKKITIFALFNLPSTCVTQVPGQKVLLIGRKEYLVVCCHPKSQTQAFRA